MLIHADILSLARRLLLVASMSVLAFAVGDVAQYQSYEREFGKESRILAGQPTVDGGPVAYTEYNRLLFPAVYVGLKKAVPSLNDVHTFMALRFVAFFGCFYLLFASIERRAPRIGLDVTAACLMMGVAFTITLARHPSATPSDIFDLTIMYFAFVFLFEERLVPAFLLACFTAVNRESGAFVGVVYFLSKVGRIGMQRLLVTSALLTSVPYALVVIIRRLVIQGAPPSNVSGQAITGVLENAGTLFHDLFSFKPASVPYILIPMLLLPALLLYQRQLEPMIRLRVVLSCVAVFMISLNFGLVREIRVFLPCVSLLFAAALVSFPSATTGNAGAR